MICKSLPTFKAAAHKPFFNWTNTPKHASEEGKNNVAKFVSALKHCSKTRDIELGKKVHRQASEALPQSNIIYTNALLNMYSKCGSIAVARQLFEKMAHKDVIAWTSLIQGYVENGQSSVALELYNRMDCDPTCVTYVAALKACIGLASEKPSEKQRCMEKGLGIHQKIKLWGLESHLVVASNLMEMYIKLGDIPLGKEVFDRMPCKSVVTWTCLILGYVENGESHVALELFHSMGCQPDHVTYVAAVKACAGLARERPSERIETLETGVKIHGKLKELALDTGTVAGSSLVDMYSKCGSMQRAQKAFDSMLRKDVIAWSCLVLGYVENGERLKALEVFSRMDCSPSPVTYTAVITACSELASESNSDKEDILEKGVAIHEQVREQSYSSNVAVAASLVKMYMKCGNMRLAREVFEEIHNKELSLWTCMMFGYVEGGEYSLALEVFDVMDCKPDHVTYVAAVKACTGLAKERSLEKEIVLKKGRALHSKLREQGVEFSLGLANCLLEMYCKCGIMKLARDVFDIMACKDVVTWTCLILGYVENGESNIALELFDKMDCEPDHVTYISVLKACTGLAREDSERNKALEKAKEVHRQMKQLGFHSNLVVGNSLVDMYSKCGELQLARETFQAMTSRNVVTWSSLILGYVDNGLYSVALELFSTMDCEPNHVTYVAALRACGGLAFLQLGRAIHARICKLGQEDDPVISNTLVDFYGRSGCTASSVQVFNGMTSPDIVSWNALIAGYNTLGDSSQVFALVKDIERAGVEMNAVTALCVLTACSQAGMVELGERYLELIHKLGISPSAKHYNCLVNMLARANKLEEAANVLECTPFRGNRVMDDFGWCLKIISP